MTDRTLLSKRRALIVGSGFGGSLTALCLKQIGWDVVVIDRQKHPRFAIGESSTPAADLVLESLSEEYNIPELRPLCRYGSATQNRANYLVGPKRGFSYFLNRRGQLPRLDANAGESLLVAASATLEKSDTHWQRSSVDNYFATLLTSYEIPLFSEWEVDSISQGELNASVVKAKDGVGNFRVWEVDLIIDASGPTGAALKRFAPGSSLDDLKTNSTAIFGHFESVASMSEIFEAARVDESPHPFPCDQAAVHQLLNEGWMWQLRFDNNLLSAGFALDRRSPETAEFLQSYPDRERLWMALIEAYPLLKTQFRQAKLVAPDQGLVFSPRIQHKSVAAFGKNWISLPNTYAFIDPMHSTGIAQTLAGIENILQIVKRDWGTARWLASCSRYSERLNAEIELIDHLVSIGYLTRKSLRDFTAASMCYFCLAIWYEEERVKRLKAGTFSAEELWLLGANENRLVNMVKGVYDFLVSSRHNRPETSGTAPEESFFTYVQTSIEPWNRVGLCVDNCWMYHYTTAPNKR